MNTKEALTRLAMWTNPGGQDFQKYDLFIDYDQLYRDVLTVCWEIWPDLYADLAQLGWTSTLAEWRKAALEQINSRLHCKLPNLATMEQGIPIQLYGVDLDYLGDSIDDNTIREQVREILTWIDSENAEAIAHCLIQSFLSTKASEQGENERIVLCLLCWLFSDSDNTFIDCTWHEYYETTEGGGGFDISWGEDNVGLINDIQEEADAIYAYALKGIQLLLTNSEWQQTFKANVQRIKTSAYWQQAKPRSLDNRDDWAWPEASLDERLKNRIDKQGLTHVIQSITWPDVHHAESGTDEPVERATQIAA